MATDTKTDAIIRDIIRTIGDSLDAGALAELKDMLQSRHGIDHEVVAEEAYEGEGNRERRGANDRLARDYGRSFPSARSAVFEMQAIERARAECQAFIPTTVLAFDSEGDVYETALNAMGVDCRGTPAANLPGIFRTMRKLQTGNAGGGLAMDSAATNSARKAFLKEFPAAVIPRRA
jgi:hypothetical protein